MYTLKIKITKEILFKSRLCNNDDGIDICDPSTWVGSSCAVALAIRDVFPTSYVSYVDIDPFYMEGRKNDVYKIYLPPTATTFIHTFDSLNANDRCNMPEIEFEISIPDEAIDLINIDEIKPLLVNHPTLELINS